MADSAAARPKIAIAGSGDVGVTPAYACLIRGTVKTMALVGQLGETSAALDQLVPPAIKDWWPAD